MRGSTAALCLLVACGASEVAGFAPPGGRLPLFLGSRSRNTRAFSVLRMEKKTDLENALELVSSSLATLARGPPGGFVSGYSVELSSEEKVRANGVREYSESLPSIRPAKPLELYEFESCPFCRKVREALSMLDIDVIVYPCPSEGDRYRPKVMEMGGKTQFPYLVDPNTSYQAFESDAIVRYLFQTYGDGIVPLELSLGPITTLSCGAVSALRPGKGRKSRASGPAPDQVLELWGYESAPPVRLVRETLCELELPYKSVTVARGSIKFQELKDREGKFQVPYLSDPNTGVSLFESADICDYLETTYGTDSSSSSSSSTTTTTTTASASSPEAVFVDPMDAPPIVVEDSGPAWEEPAVEESPSEEEPVAVVAEIVSEDSDEKSGGKKDAKA